MAKAKQPDMPVVQKYLGQIKSYETEFKKWEKRVEKILKRYRDERSQQSRDNPPASFNILWSNVQSLVPATFAQLPKPDVSRRFSDRDPIGRVASMILERALDYEINHYSDYRCTLSECVLDRFLGGRGTSWQRYEPHMRALALQEPIDGAAVTEDSDEPQEELEYECAPVDYVHWKDFGHSVARTWEEVNVVWRRVYMTKPALVTRFGEELAGKIPLDAQPDDLKRSDRANPDFDDQRRACIYEIWDKGEKKALWISKSHKEPLDVKDSAALKEAGLEFEEFFPCPRPLFATLTNESLIPVPDFTLYQDQANELDICCDRIDGLVKSLQVKGVYDASQGIELARLFTDADNTDLRAIKNWQSFAEKGGLKGAIDLVDLTPIANALVAAYNAMSQIKQQIYEITGISDIVRGQTAASETATAQQLKGQYVGLRLRDMQQDVAIFATDILRLKAQVISQFDAQTLLQISAADQLSDEDQALIPQALQMLANKPLRNFRIEIAADSLVRIDEQEEKANRMEFLTAIGGFLEKALPVAQQAPGMVPVIAELMRFAVTAFKVGRPIEGVIDQAMEEFKQQQAQPKQPPPPDPRQIQAQLQAQTAPVKAQAEQARAQADIVGAQADVAVSNNKVREAQMRGMMPLMGPQ